VGHPPLRVYDRRHAAATTWLRAGVPSGEVARRLGHNVAMRLSSIVGACSESHLRDDQHNRAVRRRVALAWADDETDLMAGPPSEQVMRLG